jgi:hypothetical protein
MHLHPHDTRRCCNAGCDNPADPSLVVTLAEQRQLRFCGEECRRTVLNNLNQGGKQPCAGD